MNRHETRLLASRGNGIHENDGDEDLRFSNLVDRVAKLFNAKQSATGPEAVQVGQVQGNVTIYHQQFNAPVSVTSEGLHDDGVQALRVLNKSSARAAVRAVMRRQVGTARAKDLDAQRLFRLRKVMESAERSRAPSAGEVSQE